MAEEKKDNGEKNVVKIPKATVKIQNGVVKMSQKCHIFLDGMFK